MNFLTYADMVSDCKRLARQLSPDLCGVLGVPRSGMLPASIIAQERGVHLGDVDSFVQSGGRFFRPGRRMNWQPRLGSVLVIDDSLHGGLAMDLAKALIRSNPQFDKMYRFDFGAIYLTPGMECRVHYWVRVVEPPRLFEWNWLHNEILEQSYCDLDGVLCEDPVAPDDGGEAYEINIATVPCIRVPRRTVETIITGRLECWRTLTQNWLDVQGIKCHSLLMAPFDTVEQRHAYGAVNWKIEEYMQSEAKLFIESDNNLAQLIAEKTRRSVLCPTTCRMY